MENYSFHEAIREVLADLDLAPTRFLWDRACGGDGLVSLFREETMSRATKYTCVDAILHDDTVLLILEIEEAGEYGFRLHRLLGKLSAAALCRSFTGANTEVPVPLAAEATFIQVVSNGGLRPGSCKVAQYANLEHDVRSRLLPLGTVAHYRVLAGMPEEFALGSKGDQLRAIVSAVARRCATAAA